ncbi:MAG: tetratricopeptide repeat protein [Bacteroidales bacterium]|nr:tetratricopeptide repeat protein [Bacteroidales bacterium]
MKKTLLFILCLLMATMAFSQKKFSELQNRANDSYQEGDYGRALHLFQQDIAQNPKAGYSHLGAGASLIELGQYEDAVPYLDNAIQYLSKKERDLAYLEKGVALIAMEEYSAAVDVMNVAIQKYPKMANLYYTRGRAYKAMEYYPSARRDFEKSVELNPNSWEATYLLATILEQYQEYDDALALAKRASLLNRQLGYLRLYTSSLHLTMGQHEEAINEFVAYIRSDQFYPELYDVLNALADTVPEQLFAKLDAQCAKYPSDPTWPWIACQACEHTGEYHRAMGYAEKCFSLSKDSTMLDLLISVEASAGEYAKAIQHSEQQMELGLPYEEFLYRKIMILANEGRLDEAIQVYESTITRQSGDTIILLQPTADSVIRHTMIDSIGGVSSLRTLIYSRKGEWAKALEFLKQDWLHAEDAADSSGIFSFEMMMYWQLGDTLSAQDAARKAIALKPDRILAYYVLGDQETANHYIAEKYDFNTADAEDWFNLAEVYADMQDPDNALKCLRKSFELGYFYGRRWIQNDYELSILHDLPEFKALIEEYTEKQKR